jgi:hypothetical protein
MAREVLYIPYGAMRVEVDTSYSSDNVPNGADVALLARGVRISDEYGEKTPLRGLRMIVTTSGLTPPLTPIPNVPIIWHEGTYIAFASGYSYKFLDDGIVSYGKNVVI